MGVIGKGMSEQEG